MAVSQRGPAAEQLRVLVGQQRSRGPAPAGAARRRVALLSTWHPEPVDNGRKQRTRQMIAALAEEYAIELVSLLPAKELAGGGLPRVPGVSRHWALPLPEFAPHALPALFAGLHPLPRSIVITWSPGTATRLAGILRAVGADAAIGTDLRTLRYLLALDPRIATLLDEPDVSPFVAEASVRQGGAGRLRASSRLWKYRRMLQHAAGRLAATIVASSQEAAAFRQLAGPAPVTVIENGVAILPEPRWHAPDTAQLLYPGSLTYGPNAEAVVAFARTILPRIAQETPAVRLAVTGAVPATLPFGVAHPRIAATGRLDAQALEAAHRRSRACVVPLLSGTGTRIKVLEAMALGMPVVSTSKGVEGLNIVPGEEFLLADTPADFAAATVRLLTDAPFAEALGARGRERIRREYTWESRGRQLRDLVRECLMNGIGTETMAQ